MTLINVNSYKAWCDASYDKHKSIPQGQIIFVNPEDIHFFFKDIQNTNRKVIVVSAGSDFGIHYQAESPINADIIKIVQLIDYNNIYHSPNYIQISVGAAEYRDCKITDKFSIKIDRFTIGTFNTIPKNVVKWFCANCNIDEPQVSFLPYGANTDTESNKIADYYKLPTSKTKQVYANFRLNSLKRIVLRDILANDLKANQLLKTAGETVAVDGLATPDWLTLEENNIPVQSFYEDMSNHYYTLCPEGNGLDSYRLIEALSVGTIPIVEKNRLFNHYVKEGFPLIVMDKLSDISYQTINSLTEEQKQWLNKWNPILITEDYWKGKIERARNLL